MYVSENPSGNTAVKIHRKIVAPAPGGGQRVLVDAASRPFAKLAAGDLLDTGDLCQVFGCSARTVYRWVADHGLQPTLKVGRELLFTKQEIVRWRKQNRPQQGRPPLAGR